MFSLTRVCRVCPSINRQVLMALSEAAEYQLLATAINSFHQVPNLSRSCGFFPALILCACLVQVAFQLSPELLSRYLDTMLRFTAAATLPNSVRSLAFETLVNLAEVPHSSSVL
jgi:hypothetical protein